MPAFPSGCLEQTAAALNVGARLELRSVMRGGLTATKVDVLAEENSPVMHPQIPKTKAQHAHDHSHSHHDHEHAHAEASRAPALSRAQPRAASPALDHSRYHSRCSALRCGENPRQPRLSAARRSRSRHPFHPRRAGALPRSGRRRHHRRHRLRRGRLRIPRRRSLALVAAQRGQRNGQMRSMARCPFPRRPRWPCWAMRPSTPPARPWSASPPPALPSCACSNVDYAPLPAMRVKARGYGAGGRDTPGEPNLLRLLVGEQTKAERTTRRRTEAEPIAVIETVIDDCTPQLLAYVSDLLLEAGAWDVYRAAVQMKKGRTGVQITVLCQSRSRARACANCSSARPPPSACAGASKTSWLWPASLPKSKPRGAKCASRSRAGPPAKLRTPRPSMRIAAARRASTRIPLKQVMQEAMRALAADLAKRGGTADGSPVQSNRCSTKCARAAPPCTTRSTACADCPLKISALPSSITIAPCAPACPK